MLDAETDDKSQLAVDWVLLVYPRKHQQHAMGDSLEKFIRPRRMPSGPRYGPLK
jgi:hypothetical protein